jgi:hypothetical protein
MSLCRLGLEVCPRYPCSPLDSGERVIVVHYQSRPSGFMLCAAGSRSYRLLFSQLFEHEH